MEYRMQHWEQIVTECNTSGMRKIDWMKLHNVSPKAFYRWQKILRDHAIEEHEKESNANSATDLTAVNQASVPVMVDMTAMITSQLESGARQSETASLVSTGLTPEIMLQAGQYTLYIGSGITESTLSTVLKVISHV